MTVLNLPGPDFLSNRNSPPAFADHTLFTERITSRYEYAEHTAGAGILYMLSGKGDYYLNGQRERLAPEDFLVVNSGSRLAVKLPETPAQPGWLFFRSGLIAQVMESLDLPTERLLENGSAAQGGQAQGNTRRLPDLSCLERIHSGNRTLSGKLDWLARQPGTCSSFAALKEDCLIRSILEELILHNHAALRVAGRLPVTKRSTKVELFKRVSLTREWILENYSSPITLNDLAKIAMLNSQHFLRMFSQCYGITPHQYLIRVRLDQARKMLTGSGENISAICAATGFESLSSFSLLFRQRYGITPSGFRQQQVVMR